jgi:hypothetical protein
MKQMNERDRFKKQSENIYYKKKNKKFEGKELFIQYIFIEYMDGV